MKTVLVKTFSKRFGQTFWKSFYQNSFTKTFLKRFVVSTHIRFQKVFAQPNQNVLETFCVCWGRQVVNPRHQTPQRKPVAMPETPLQVIPRWEYLSDKMEVHIFKHWVHYLFVIANPGTKTSQGSVSTVETQHLICEFQNQSRKHEVIRRKTYNSFNRFWCLFLDLFYFQTAPGSTTNTNYGLFFATPSGGRNDL